MASHPYYSANQGPPVVVQGVDVSHQYQPNQKAPQPQTQPTLTQLVGDEPFEKGEAQSKRCNDLFFALLFYAHLGVMVWVAVTYAPAMYSQVAENYGGGGRRVLQEDQEQDYSFSTYGILVTLSLCFAVAFALSTLALTFLMKYAEGVIKFALITNVVLYALLGLASLLSGALPGALMFLVFAALTAWYASVVWGRIPFAASNMRTAISGVRANFGLTFFAYSSLVVMFGWTAWWSIAAVSSMFVANGCNANGECETEPNAGLVFLLFLSYYWVAQVIKNTVHVTVAGTIGTWWFEPQAANSCCSSAVRDSFVRSVTWSFGSICFGSLIVAIIQALREMARQARQSDDGMLMCCAECILGCLESLVEYFNTWAFVYVGLYGYSFMEAGRNVMTLFRTRGWTTIITDTLVDTALFMISVGVGLLTGIVSLLVAGIAGLEMVSAFVVGLLFGIVLSATLFGVVSSAVNTVIVCYAEAPNEFQANHPQLSEDMRASWRQAWPSEFHY